MANVYQEIRGNKIKSFVILFLFLILTSAAGWVIGSVAVGGSFLDVENGLMGLAIAFGIAIVYGFIGYFTGDKMALASTGAKRVKKTDNPELYRMVENLAITAGLPTPKVYIIDSPALNAFATGRDPEHSSIAFTTGIIDVLNKKELEGVTAHELSHIKNYDIRVLLVSIAFVGAINMITHYFLRVAIHSDSGRKNGKAAVVMIVIAIALAILAPLFAMLIQLAVSRKRESLADASGAMLTRSPE